MNDNFFKFIGAVMNAIEKDAVGKAYLINQDIEAKAYSLYSDFKSYGIDARVEYIPAFSQIAVIAECAVLDIYKNSYKNNFFSADVICIDTTSDDLLHIECMFNDAFKKVGVLNEQ